MERVVGEHRKTQGDASRRASIGEEAEGQRAPETNAHASLSAPQQPIVTELQPFENLGLNPAVFDPALDFDVFGLFDPAFDLAGMDACLDGNLDLGFGMGMVFQ